MPVDFPPTKLTLDYLVIRDGEGHYLQVPKLTTTERDALSPTNGILIYNTTTAQFERYADDAWGGFGSDLTGAEIKALYEGESNTNAYTDAEKSKLAGIESGATADQTGAEIKTAYDNEYDYSDDTSASTNANDYVKLREFTLISTQWGLKIKFKMRMSGFGDTGYIRIYRNGNFVDSTTHSTSSGSWVTKTQDISGWSNNDTLEFWGKTGSTRYVELRYIDIKPSTVTVS